MGLRDYLKKLDENNLMLHINERLSTKYEIPAAIKYRAEREHKAIFFDNVAGYDVQVVGNIFAGTQQQALALGVPEASLNDVFVERAQKLIKPQKVKDSPLREVVEDDIDILRTMPVLTHHEGDAGPYMTSCITIAKDPETGQRGMGLHRIQVKGKDKIGIYLATPPLSHFLAKAEKMNVPLEIAIVSGVSPAVFFASVFVLERTMATRQDKLEVAGGFANAPIKVIDGVTVDLEVPAEAEFVLEGQIIPHKREQEGPFGESTGYYLTYHNPVAKINFISHRKNPIYHALLPFSDEVESLIKVMMLPTLYGQIRKDLPEIKVTKLNFMALGEICVVQIAKKHEDEGKKLLEYLLPNPFTKIAIVTDEDVEVDNPYEIAWAVSTRVRFEKDAFIRSDLPGLMIDPSVGELERMPDTSLQFGKTAKLGLDATKPLSELKKYERADVPKEVKQKILKLLGSKVNKHSQGR